MKKNLPFSIFIWLFSIGLFSSGCAEKTEVQFPFTPDAACGNVMILSSQSDIDQFNQTEIKGDLIISGNNITDLSGLSNLSYICGNLEINFCSTLSSTAGLNANLTVGGHFFVTGNPNLVDFRGFPTNFSLNGPLKIQSNSKLISLNGFSSEIALQKLELLDNNNLQSLAGVPDHVDVFRLEGSPKIKNLDGLTPGFDCLEFNIHQCESLESLQGFSGSIQSLFILSLKNNVKLENISALSNLRYIRKELTIEGNTKLSSCCSLRQLIDSFGIIPFKISIRNNHMDCIPATILENGPC